MITMEQRAFITIENFPAAHDEDAWVPFIETLERHSEDLGPVLAWDAPHTAQVVVSANVDDHAQFAQAAVVRITEALQATGMAHLYPSAIEIEPAGDDARHPVTA